MFLSDGSNIKLPLSISTPETNNICFNKIVIDFCFRISPENDKILLLSLEIKKSNTIKQDAF